MTAERVAARQPALDRRPPVSVTPPTRPATGAVTAGAVQLLQRRLGNQGTQTLFAQTSPPGGSSASRSQSEGGKRTYRTSDGQMVELPPDMTAEQAAGLEAEAIVAEKRLGKGPPPKPVPDVKTLTRREEKKEKPKAAAKGKKADTGKGKAAPKAGGAAGVMLKAVSSSKVAQYLAAKGAPVLLKGIGMLQKLKQNEQTHDDAAEKLNQSEKAVVIPPSEGQSKSNAGHVNTVSDRPAPTVNENQAKQKLQETLEENIPQTIEDVDNFKRDKKAQHMGVEVTKVVQGDKNAVISAFDDMEHTPPPAPPEHTPEALPPAEVAPPTAIMNLGHGAVAPLQKEHTDLSNYTKEADSKLKEEGVAQEQLDMVDSGDLAEANKEKKGMEKTAKTEPLAVQKYAQQEADKVAQDLQQEEKKDRDGLQAKRKADLGATTQKQTGTKSALEKKREEVANKINGIYKDAQDKVKKKLTDLETQSMKRFDEGNDKAGKEFEDNVNRELDAFKAERYSGFWGKLKKAKDWLLGMDDLPGVKAIFDRNRTTFVKTINRLVDDITADNKRVIQECKDELANAKKAIKDYVDKLGPDLKDIGKKAAEEMNAKINELDRFVNQKEQELQQKLKDKQQAAIKAIDDKIEKMKEAMSGALSKLGKLLLLAAKKFFTWALQKFGYSLAEIEGIINKGAAVLKAIFTQPIQFVKNLINATSTGFKNFGKNFLTHLKNAIFDWLTGALEGIQLPSTWDLKGIASVALQMLGLTWQNIRGKLVKFVGENTVKAMETGFDLVVTLVKDGPMAAWEKIKEMADDIKEAFIDGVKDFVKIKIVEKAIETVVAMFIPGAGIIRAIVGIYDTVVFFIQKAKQIAQMVGNFLGSIGEIAMGNIGAAATALEQGLATALKLVINFLAKFLRLDGITAKVRNAIQKLRAKVDSMLDNVVGWIGDKAKKLFGGGKAGKAEGTGDVKDQARQALEEKIKTEPTFEKIEAAAAQVQKDLKPLGLKQVIVHRPNEENVISIAAEASTIKELLKLAPKGKTLTLAVKIRLGGGGEKVPETHGLNVAFPQQTHPITGKKTSRPTLVEATMVLPPVPGSGEVEAVTWNTNLEHLSPSDVATHAEPQLESFFDSKIMTKGFTDRIEAIELYLHPYSPCESCSKILDEIGASLPGSCTKDKRLLVYERAYPGGKGGLNRTTDATLTRLRERWTVVGPPPVKGDFFYKQ